MIRRRAPSENSHRQPLFGLVDSLLERLEVSLFPENARPPDGPIVYVIRITPSANRNRLGMTRVYQSVAAASREKTPDPFILLKRSGASNIRAVRSRQVDSAKVPQHLLRKAEEVYRRLQEAALN